MQVGNVRDSCRSCVMRDEEQKGGPGGMLYDDGILSVGSAPEPAVLAERQLVRFLPGASLSGFRRGEVVVSDQVRQPRRELQLGYDVGAWDTEDSGVLVELGRTRRVVLSLCVQAGALLPSSHGPYLPPGCHTAHVSGRAGI
jgi:hypothetical protein